MNPASSEPAKPAKAVSSLVLPAWMLLGCMWLAYFLNYCDRQSVFSIYPILKSDLGFTDTQLGLIGATFSFVYGICSPIAGQIADRASRQMLVIASLIIWSVLTIVTGFSTSVIMMISCRAALSLSESLFVPSAVSLTSGAYPPEARSRAVSILMCSQIVGVIGGGWFAGAMAEHGHWRGSFFTLGILGLLYAIPCYLCLKWSPNPVRPDTKSSGAFLAASALARVPSYIALGLVFSLFEFGVWLAYGWLPTFFHEKFALRLGEAAFAATFYLQTANIVGMLGGAWLSDRLYLRWKSARFWLLGGGMIACAPFFYLLGNCDSLGQTKLAAIALGLFSGLVVANIFPAAFEVVPLDTRSSAVGFLNSFGSILSGLGMFAGGYLKQSVGLGDLMTVAAFIYVIGGLGMIMAMKTWFERDYARVH